MWSAHALSMPDTKRINVEVVYALPEHQRLVPLELAAGSSARQAVEQSGLLAEFPEIELANAHLGIFGKLIAAETLLQDGDRVEIYRPLKADPKEVRRQLAAAGKTMGRDKR